MIKTTRKNPLIDKRIFTQEHWVEKLNELLPKLEGKRLVKAMIEVDEKYDRVCWGDYTRNAVRGLASLQVTQEIVEVLERYFAGERAAEKQPKKREVVKNTKKSFKRHGIAV